MTEQYISICKKFIEVISGITEKDKKSIDYEVILNILDCLHLDDDCHLGIRFPHFHGHGDKSWFYCYEGEHDTYIEEYNNSVKDMDDFFICYLYDEPYNIFNHLTIEPTEKGAWQAYLMSIATHFLPTYGHGGYSRRKMVFSYEELRANKYELLLHVMPNAIPDFGDLSPSVVINDNLGVVKSHYWNMWCGLVRETVKIRFLNKKAYFLDPIQHETLFKYNCGIRF